MNNSKKIIVMLLTLVSLIFIFSNEKMTTEKSNSINIKTDNFYGHTIGINSYNINNDTKKNIGYINNKVIFKDLSIKNIVRNIDCNLLPENRGYCKIGKDFVDQNLVFNKSEYPQIKGDIYDKGKKYYTYKSNKYSIELKFLAGFYQRNYDEEILKVKNLDEKIDKKELDCNLIPEYTGYCKYGQKFYYKDDIVFSVKDYLGGVTKDRLSYYKIGLDGNLYFMVNHFFNKNSTISNINNSLDKNELTAFSLYKFNFNNNDIELIYEADLGLNPHIDFVVGENNIILLGQKRDNNNYIIFSIDLKSKKETLIKEFKGHKNEIFNFSIY